MTTSLAIVETDAEAAGTLADLHARAFAEPEGAGETSRGWSEQECEALMTQPGAIGLLAMLRGRIGAAKPVGFAILKSAADEAEILSIGVLPTTRGRGVGAALLRDALERLPRHKARRLFLEVDGGNAAALALYKRFGFSEVGRRPSYYAPGADAIVMRREV